MPAVRLALDHPARPLIVYGTTTVGGRISFVDQIGEYETIDFDDSEVFTVANVSRVTEVISRPITSPNPIAVMAYQQFGRIPVSSEGEVLSVYDRNIYSQPTIYTSTFASQLGSSTLYIGSTLGLIDSNAAGRSVVELLPAPSLPPPSLEAPENSDDRTTFRRLLERWQEELMFLSSTSAMVMCQSYQQIIGLGQTALPFIFDQLRSEGDEPDQWFWALCAITRQNPVPRDLWGDRKAVARVWLRWACEHGYTARSAS